MEKIFVLRTMWSFDYESDCKVEVFKNLEDAKKELRFQYERFLVELYANEDGKWNDFDIYDSGKHAHICEAYDWSRNSNVWDIFETTVR